MVLNDVLIRWHLSSVRELSRHGQLTAQSRWPANMTSVTLNAKGDQMSVRGTESKRYPRKPSMKSSTILVYDATT
jgi:hypothetical protein